MKITVEFVCDLKQKLVSALINDDRNELFIIYKDKNGCGLITSSYFFMDEHNILMFMIFLAISIVFGFICIQASVDYHSFYRSMLIFAIYTILYLLFVENNISVE